MNPEWIELGRGLCYGGAGLAFGLAGAGSAWGIAIASHSAAGVMREKPELFGRMLVMIALPGTQGFYGFISAILMMTQTGLIGGNVLKITLGTGLALFFVGLGEGLALLISAIKQGEASAAGISLLARRPEAAGRAILFPAFVETYAVVSLLATILFIIFLTQPVALQCLEP
ncbi:MAG: V-type sodium ATPase subunit K [Syntrophorhabdus sp. PtaU1.Bin050]|nr:MAG: V-type sodium ATPase subunit K [Syntrophorhabdus sp. PtaU1.Bin050]